MGLQRRLSEWEDSEEGLKRRTKSIVKIPPLPTFAHYIDAKVGKKNLLKYSISLVHMPQFLMMFTCEVNDHHDFCSFVHHKNSSFTEHTVLEVSGACVCTKLRGIKTTCITSGDWGDPAYSEHASQAMKSLVVTCEQGHEHT